MAEKAILTMKGITKTFPGVKALSNVDFKLCEGDIHALMGENGAGKSTLIKVLTGIYPFDAGEIIMDGKPMVNKSPQDAQNNGISTVYQEVNLCPNLTVAENLFIGREPRKLGMINWKEMNARSAKLLESLNINVPPTQMLDECSVAIQQMIAIARAVDMKCKVLILDEPTNHLDMRSKDVLKEAIKEFDGTVIVVSHDREFLDGLVTKVYEFGGGLVKEHIGGIYDFLQKKKMESLNELQLSQSPQVAPEKKEETPDSDNKLSYEAQKELNKKIRKLEKQVADCEAKIEKLEGQVGELEQQMATPEGASDMKLYEQHQQLKKQISDAEDEWTSLLSELEEMKQE